MAKPYTTRTELNQRAYDLGFRGKEGGVAGARNAQLAYHKTADYQNRLADIQAMNEDEDLGFTQAEMGTAADAARPVIRRNSEAFMRDFIYYRRVTPDAPLDTQVDTFRQLFANPQALREFANTFAGEFVSSWYHIA